MEGITLADRDGAVFTLGVDVLAAKGPSGIGFDPQNDVLRLVRWQDDTTLRLFVLRSGRVQPGDDEPPELRYFRVDGTVGGGHVAWMPPVEMTAAEQLAALGFPPQAEWEALLDRAMGEVPDAASDQPIAMFLSADGSAWAAGVPYGQRPGGRGVPETWQLVILTQQPVAVEMEEEYGRARRLQNVLDVIVTTGD